MEAATDNNITAETEEKNPELVAEKTAEAGSGPHTPDAEEAKKAESPVGSPPVLQKEAEETEVCGSDESTKALASADEEQKLDKVENDDLGDESLTTVPGGKNEQTETIVKETLKRKGSNAGEEQDAKRPAEEKDIEEDVQEIGASPSFKNEGDDEVVLLDDDEKKFKAPELPKEKNGNCKSAESD